MAEVSVNGDGEIGARGSDGCYKKYLDQKGCQYISKFIYLSKG